MLCLLLRACAQVKLKIDRDHPDFNAFVKLLVVESKSEGAAFEEDKNQAYWERALMISWERIVDQSETKQRILFVDSHS